MTVHKTDYLIIGAGAAGMAFADTILDETDARVTIVDRQGRPGGHWNDAYPFVTLHQPSAFYGVNSTPLGSDLKDPCGVNAGLYELASGAEVSGYYDAVMMKSCGWSDVPVCHGPLYEKPAKGNGDTQPN